jgi:hypothetical protein
MRRGWEEGEEGEEGRQGQVEEGEGIIGGPLLVAVGAW